MVYWILSHSNVESFVCVGTMEFFCLSNVYFFSKLVLNAVADACFKNQVCLKFIKNEDT